MKPPNSPSRFRHLISRYRGLVALAFSLCLCGALAQPTQGWPEELESLQEEARAMARPVLLVFSGSDWCGPCIRLQREVLTDPVFVQFAAEELLVVTADFPRKKKNALSPELAGQNRLLADRYNPSGRFPLLLLLQPDGRLLGEVADQVVRTDELIGRIRELRERAVAQSYERTLALMGSRFELTVVAPDPATAATHLDAAVEEIRRIEGLLSSWDPHSQTSAVNRAAGAEAVAVDHELFSLLQRALRISELTQGAFDPTVGPLLQLWRFDGSLHELPAQCQIDSALTLVGSRQIVLDEQSGTVGLPRAGMRLGFGAIGKGYAADRAARILRSRGVSSGVVNAGGDLLAWGRQPDGEPWQVGIADPVEPERIFSWLPVSDQAVVTSGDYERFVEIDGRRYSHILDPRTGYPAAGLKSVTVIAASAELADALATGIFVLGKEVGLDLVDQLPGIECILVDSDDRLFTSRGLELKPAK